MVQGYSEASVLGGLGLGQQPWSGGAVGQCKEEISSAIGDKGLRAGRVCGWRVGNSLDSRGDRGELRQTHERAQILGKNQLLTEILGKLLQAGCPCAELF